MRKYEMAVVVSGKLEEDQKNAVLDNAKALVQRFGGEIKSVDEWGKRKFAYEIQKMSEGYYNFIHFEAEPTAPAEIESRMRIMDNVVRYLIVLDESPEKTGGEEAAPEEAEAEAAGESLEEAEEPAVEEAVEEAEAEEAAVAAEEDAPAAADEESEAGAEE